MNAARNDYFRKGVDWVCVLHEGMKVYILYGDECCYVGLLKNNPWLEEALAELGITKPGVYPLHANAWYYVHRKEQSRARYGTQRRTPRRRGTRTTRSTRGCARGACSRSRRPGCTSGG